MPAEPMSAERLAEIERRERAATPGPWTWERTEADEKSLGTVGNIDFGHVLSVHICPACQKSGLTCIGPTAENGAFIKESRQDIPDLITEVKRLQAVEAELRKDKARLQIENSTLVGIVSGLYEMATGQPGTPLEEIDAEFRKLPNGGVK